MRKVLAALAVAAAFGAVSARAEDLTHCKTGSAQVAKQQWTAARTEFKLCLAQGKLGAESSAIAHLNLSAVAYNQKKWTDVISEYDLSARAVTAAGGQFKPPAPALFFRGIAYAELNQMKNAKGALDQAVALSPKDPRFLLARMDVLVQLNQMDAALADGATLIASGPKDIQVIAHMRRSIIYEGLKRNDDALKEIDAAAALDPQSMEIVQARMNLFVAQQAYDKALAEGARLAASPVQRWAVTGRLARATILRGQSKPDDALSELNAALKLAPNDPTILADRMTLFAEMNQMDKALADSQILAASKNPKIALTGHAFRGVVFDGEKRYSDALNEADAMLKIDAKNPVGLNNKCMALANMERGAEAVTMCQQALAVAPKSPRVLNSNGYALEKAGRLKEAVSYYQKAADADPQDMQNQTDLKRAQAALAAGGAH